MLQQNIPITIAPTHLQLSYWSRGWKSMVSFVGNATHHDDYATTCRCCGRKGGRWYNSRYVNTRSITPAKTLLSRKSVENRSRDYIVGRVGHYVMAVVVLCDAGEICFYGDMTLLCLFTAYISWILCIIHRLMPYPILYYYVGARDNLVWLNWYVMSLIIDGSGVVCWRCEQKKQILLI